MAEDESANPLVSSSPASDTSPEIQLHPLVLLTISDYITRHTLRKQSGPIVGAIIGQQNGREITMEVAFECGTVAGPDGSILLDAGLFSQRVDQYKEVYKSPQLELVGWFTIGSTFGPGSHHVPIHLQLQKLGYESACLLLFHPNAFTAGGKLPLTLYEGVVEGDQNAMEMDGVERAASLKFRKLSYAVETGEAEMISVDFVAKGGGNATAVEAKDTKEKSSEPKAKAKDKGKGKAKEGNKDSDLMNGNDESYLSPEDDELLSSLTAKANAIKMLHSRIDLLRSYLTNLPQSYLTDTSTPPSASGDTSTALNHQVLRSILALQARIPLLVPPDTEAFAREALEQKTDTALVQLLSSVTSSVHEAGEMNEKFRVVDTRRNIGRNQDRRGGPRGGMVPDAGDFGGDSMMGSHGYPEGRTFRG
ncbi:hypothetical protein NA57DRAFT_54830 [Rhizodiscina lignyota]|uniref:COP9 signalosome complex subunit 6 n=1 Tax=Rhizodiscina lignyota TaxID=1504668 RepID=A0A9P4IMC0_9PEZI|nr:hypothetical protein NA57DRAFT_54830 [Rhizodiscina lignyota]